MNVDEELVKSVNELSAELGAMHGVLYKLIIGLSVTKLSIRQVDLVNAANGELRESQKRFFCKYADTVGGAAPERN